MSTDAMPAPTIVTPLSNGEISVHAFTSPEMLLANTTYVIEGPDSVIVVDGQFIAPVAAGFRAFAESLGKPIARAYLTHDHPDHWFGLSAAFTDVPVHALPETIAFLREKGEVIRQARAQVYGDFVPAAVTVPGHEAGEGRVEVDGITLELTVVRNAETATQLLIGLPQVNALIVGDLVYSGAHVYVVDDVDNWASILSRLAEADYNCYLPGHGAPADAREVLANREYLLAARQLARDSADSDSYKAALLAAYPQRSGAAIIDIYAPTLFGQEENIHG